mgnify:FL=1
MTPDWKSLILLQELIRSMEAVLNTDTVDKLRHAAYDYTAPPHTDLPHAYFEESAMIMTVGRSMGKSTHCMNRMRFGGDFMYQLAGTPLLCKASL